MSRYHGPQATTFEIAEASQPQIEAVITHTEDDDFIFHDYLAATWQPWRGDHAEAGYWLISGDNTGSQQFVVWPYMIDAFVALLARCKAATPDARPAQHVLPGAARGGSPSPALTEGETPMSFSVGTVSANVNIETKVASPIEGAVGAIRASLIAVTKRLDELEGRLAPVLRPVFSDSPELRNIADGDPRSPHVDDLHGHAQLIRILGERVEEILARIDL